jgi:galactokinase
VAWAPGRINLIGEHTDYTGGFVLPVAINRVVALAGRRIEDWQVHVTSRHHRQMASFPADRLALLSSAPAPTLPFFARYVRGVLAEMAALPGAPAVPVFDAIINGDVPVGGGLSSSAALEVATATFVAALGGPALDPLDMAQLCQRAERKGVGVKVGILDQAASCLARFHHALLLDCRSLSYTHIPILLSGYALAVFETGVPHTLASSGYNERVSECRRATSLLRKAIIAEDATREITQLRDITAEDLARYGQELPETLRRRARHVVSENARVHQAVAALRAADAQALGDLLYASHASLRDDYCVSCPELDAVVEIVRNVHGVYGARMIGGGFGGSVLILAEQSAVNDIRRALMDEYPRRTQCIGRLHLCRISGGPGAVTVA